MIDARSKVEARGISTSDIDRDRWAAVFDEITRRRAGQPVRLEAFGWNIGVQTEAHGLPFRGISYGGKGGDAQVIEILLGVRPDDHITHRISDATRVRVKYSGVARAEVVAIESGEGYTSLLSFEPMPNKPA
jgi:hypothetical protein